LIAIVCSLISATLYGGADFFGGIATKRSSVLSVTAISQASGLVVLLAALPFLGGHPSPADLAWGLLGGVFGGIGISLLYHALSIGKMGVVSPITAVLAAIVPVAVGVMRGDPLHWFQFAGIGCALVAVVLISFSIEPTGEREYNTKGVKEAILSGIAIGAFFLVLGLSRPSAGIDALLAARVGSALFLLALGAITRTDLRPRNGTLPLLLLIGVVDMIANILFVIAAQTGALAISAILSSLYPASTVFLARAILKERLQLSQKLGVVLALAGVALIAA
jgi:drug/metabolite transporter (DMT)-like permease